MSTTEKFCLKWNDFQKNINSTFGSLREDTEFADVTLACENGKQVEAHKVILAASSPFFQNLLKTNKHSHPMIYMRGLKSEDLLAILDFLYHGEANIYQENLDSFLAIAEELKLKGLSGGTEEIKPNDDDIHQVKIKPKDDKQVKSKSQQHHQDLSMAYTNPLSKLIDKYEEVSDAIGKSVALTGNNISVDLQELDEKIKSLMTTTNEIVAGKRRDLRVCNVCGKKGQWTNIRDHIEANHIDGISHSCTHCEKTFRSRPALRMHKSSNHKF